MSFSVPGSGRSNRGTARGISEVSVFWLIRSRVVFGIFKNVDSTGFVVESLLEVSYVPNKRRQWLTKVVASYSLESCFQRHFVAEITLEVSTRLLSRVISSFYAAAAVADFRSMDH